MSETQEGTVTLRCKECGGAVFYAFPDLRRKGLVLQCVEDENRRYRVEKGLERKGVLLIPSTNQMTCLKCGGKRFRANFLGEDGGLALVCMGHGEKTQFGEVADLR